MTRGIAPPEEVHRFWFADTIDDPQAAGARNALWFGSATDLDATIRLRFEPTLAAAAHGDLEAWESTPQSCAALVIVLDQFPRNVHRGTPAAFANDARALGVTRRALAAENVAALSIPERTFLLMPYQHVENAGAQREGLSFFERLHADAPPAWREFALGILDYARRHLDIVETYGRFPHRNAVLGRSSTAAERDYLASHDETFGQVRR